MCHIVSIVINAFIIITPKRGKFAITYFLPIQRELIKTESAYIGDGFGHFFIGPVRTKRLSQADASLCQGIYCFPGGFDFRILQFAPMKVSALGQTGFLPGNSTDPLPGSQIIGNDVKNCFPAPLRRGIRLVPNTNTPQIGICRFDRETGFGHRN